MSAFHLLLRGRIAALRQRTLQDSVPPPRGTPCADARKLSHPSSRRLPRDTHGSPA